MAKIDEILYPTKLDSQSWLRQKPFGPGAVSGGHFKDFGNILQLLDPAPEARILDLGVGSGWTSRFLARCRYDVVGIDISPHMLEIARREASTEGLSIRFETADLEDLSPLDLGTFDACLAYDVLHHVEELESVLEQVASVLRPGGRFLAVEPNWNHRFSPESIAATERYGVREEGIPPFLLRRLLKKVGFQKSTRYHCADGLYSSRITDILKHLGRPLLHRLLKAHYATRVWMLAVR